MPDKYGVQSWEQMVMQIVVHGRPNDIRAAAAGWDLVLRNLNSVRTSLDQNVADLGTTWNGEAYESFKEHIAAISENIQAVSDEANRMNTVTGTLTESAARLEAAQNEIPIPAGLEDEVAAARNEGGGIPEASSRPPEWASSACPSARSASPPRPASARCCPRPAPSTRSATG